MPTKDDYTIICLRRKLPYTENELFRMEVDELAKLTGEFTDEEKEYLPTVVLERYIYSTRIDYMSSMNNLPRRHGKFRKVKHPINSLDRYEIDED